MGDSAAGGLDPWHTPHVRGGLERPALPTGPPRVRMSASSPRWGSSAALVAGVSGGGGGGGGGSGMINGWMELRACVLNKECPPAVRFPPLSCPLAAPGQCRSEPTETAGSKSDAAACLPACLLRLCSMCNV